MAFFQDSPPARPSINNQSIPNRESADVQPTAPHQIAKPRRYPARVQPTQAAYAGRTAKRRAAKYCLRVGRGNGSAPCAAIPRVCFSGWGTTWQRDRQDKKTSGAGCCASCTGKTTKLSVAEQSGKEWSFATVGAFFGCFFICRECARNYLADEESNNGT